MSANDSAKLSKEQVDAFAALWTDIDVHASNMMTVHNLRTFVTRLPHPMGMKRGVVAPTDAEVKEFLREWTCGATRGGALTARFARAHSPCRKLGDSAVPGRPCALLGRPARDWAACVRG